MTQAVWVVHLCSVIVFCIVSIGVVVMWAECMETRTDEVSASRRASDRMTVVLIESVVVMSCIVLDIVLVAVATR